MKMNFNGYLRPDGSIGIRNRILIIAVDECCDGIAQSIGRQYENTVVMTNWYTCMLGGNEESLNQMIANAKNPNVAGVLVIAMGCGSINPAQITSEVEKVKKPVYAITCQEEGGTRKSVDSGHNKIRLLQDYVTGLKREPFPMACLVVGIKCGGSDTSSGIASNPCVGAAADKLIDLGGICIGGELFELQGCQEVLDVRASSPAVAQKIERLIENERKRWSVEGTDVETMSIGNSIGGLTTIEEKSLGALHKFGSKEIVDILEINDRVVEKPTSPGFYLSEATMLCGGSGVNFASYGAHMILWTCGAAGFENPLVPVIRVSANEDLINDDIDVDATGIMNGKESLDIVSDRIIDKLIETASGQKTQIEGIGGSTLTLYQKDQRLDTLLNIKCYKEKHL
ncbi:MAG: UxaA family hydrolase [Desulfobacterales bacterium]|nr:UxaA family hydrolase [Desulfobacterales bacterium]MCP4163403.1 UxaA family hydrolase [Deltaproteobacteria bacterium]